MSRDALFSSTEAIRFGWRTTMANAKPLLVISAIGGFLALLNQALSGPDHAPRQLLGIGVQVLQAVVTMAFIRVSLKLHDGERIDWSRPGDLLTGFFPYLLTSVLFGLIVFGGFLLLVVPGVYWAVKFGFATFAAVDRKVDPLDALRESSRVTKGHRWHLLGFGLLLGLVNLVGLLALGVGLLVTIPTTFLAATYVFRRLQARAEMISVPELPTAPPTPATSH